MSKDNNKSSEYSIGAVARLTGLSTQIIRAWERRYGAVVASRAPNGRRVYFPDDVEKLTLLKTLTDLGSPISAVANLSATELETRLTEMDVISSAPFTGVVRVAVLGSELSTLLDTEVVAESPLQVTTSNTDLGQFSADVRDQPVDVLIVEAVSLNETTVRQLTELVELSKSHGTVVAYSFARETDVDFLTRKGARLLRMPVSADELIMAAVAAATNKDSTGRAKSPGRKRAQEQSRRSSALALPPKRRFTRAQLNQLARIETNVDCECPRHIAEILKTLTAFEVYSAECEDKDDESAELHAYLHRATANARALIEDALDRLIEVEDIKV